MATFLVWAATTAYVLAGLPWRPVATPDSESYLALDPSRPPGYGWLLNAYAWATGGGGAGPESLGGLPLLQTALIALALLAFALQLDRLLGRRWAGALAVVAVWTHVGTYEATRWAMSEALFLPAALLGLAFGLAHARRGDAGTLAGAAACLALATLARNAGLALLAAPAVLVLLDPARRLGARLLRLLMAGGIAALVLAAGIVDSQARHGRPALGSNSGISLLGKGLLLLRPAPGQDPVLAEAARRAAAAREAIAAAPGFRASLRAQAQAYELLRWPSFFPAAEAAWPAWREGDAAAQNAIAARLAREAIAADPGGYAALVARDWLALLLPPHLWPPALAGGDSMHPFFADCHAVPGRCWAFFAMPLPLHYSVATLAVCLGGLLASALLLAVALPALLPHRRSGGGLPPPERAMLALVVAIHATLLGTAAAEAGLWRYALLVNAMHAALIAWAIHRVLAWAAAARQRRPAAARAPG